MTAQDINITIARLCGWTSFRLGTDGYFWGIDPERPNYTRMVPSYCNNLDAIKKARVMLIGDHKAKKVAFLNHLRGVLASVLRRPVSDYDLLNAEAHEITEALLRTVGEWKEE